MTLCTVNTYDTPSAEVIIATLPQRRSIVHDTPSAEVEFFTTFRPRSDFSRHSLGGGPVFGRFVRNFVTDAEVA